MPRSEAQKRKQKPDSAYYVPMSKAVGQVVRRSASTAVDEAGQLIKTNRRVQRLGVGKDYAVKMIEDGETLTALYAAFADQIREEDYTTFPTMLEFADFVGCSYDTVLRARQAYQNSDAAIREITADLITQGMANGAYKAQGAIFTLKNRCGWADRVETTTKTVQDKVDKATADRLIREYVANLPPAGPAEGE